MHLVWSHTSRRLYGRTGVQARSAVQDQGTPAGCSRKGYSVSDKRTCRTCGLWFWDCCDIDGTCGASKPCVKHSQWVSICRLPKAHEVVSQRPKCISYVIAGGQPKRVHTVYLADGTKISVGRTSSTKGAAWLDVRQTPMVTVSASTSHGGTRRDSKNKQ